MLLSSVLKFLSISNWRQENMNEDREIGEGKREINKRR